MTTAENVNILRSDCQLRYQSVTNAAYQVELVLAKGKEYSGRSVVSFDLKSHGSLDNTTVNFSCNEIVYLEINGVKIEDVGGIFSNEGGVIVLEAKYLQEKNTLVVVYRSFYNNNGCGLHSYTDTVDGNQYLYTQFESPYCHTVMPCFEQPDIKASLSLKTYCEADWNIIANESVLEEKVNVPSPDWVPEGLGIKEAKYALHYTTPPISCYLYAICAGPYEAFSADRNVYNKSPPMRLYVRQSFKHLITEDYLKLWFECSEHACTWLGDFMGVPYPFSKLDQIFCPEYNWGAMENVGCITYTENCLFKQTPSRTKVISVCNVILHEITHQWFGNLITMKWWDDLWLNEAFATYMSSYAQDSFMDHAGDCWLALIDRSASAMGEDATRSTHPIACGDICKDTQQSEIIFDGISYGKSSHFLRMLAKFIGDGAFRDGVRLYFSRHQYGNTVSDDLLDCFDLCSSFKRGEVKAWCHTWLNNQGVINLRYSCEGTDGNDVTTIKIIMGFEENAHPVLKQIPMDIDLYGENGKLETISVVLDAVEEQAVPVATKGVRSALLNAGCHAYTRIIPSRPVLEYFCTNYDNIANSMDRLVLIKALVALIKDGELGVGMYLSLFERKLISEPCLFLREGCYKDFVSFIGAYVPIKHMVPYMERGFDLFKSRLGDLHKDEQTTLVDNMISFVNGANLSHWGFETLQKDGNIVDGEKLLYTLTDQQKRDLLVRVCREESISDDSIEQIKKKVILNVSDDDARCALRCQSARPDVKKKSLVWGQLLNPEKGLSQTNYQDKCQFFVDPTRPELMMPFIGDYYAFLPTLFEKFNHFMARQFLFLCSPSNVNKGDESCIERLQVVLNASSDQFLFKYGETLLDRDIRRCKALKVFKEEDWP